MTESKMRVSIAMAEFKRLPSHIVPTHYSLELKPDLKAFTFEGNMNILINVNEATKTITLNALNITINSSELSLHSSDELKLKSTSIYYSTKNETATLTFGEEVPAGSTANLRVSFTGEIADDMQGFYRSKYFMPNGEERYSGVTQFEANEARRCFPCWDEPAIKATFDIALVVPNDRVALSNMPISNEEHLQDGLRRISFDRTPIMSTYLVAMAVGEYDYVVGKSQDNVIVRVFTPIGKKEEGKFALDVGTKALFYFRNYFKIAYPLPKLDFITLLDFPTYGMENWGLVTYSEAFLLFDPENTSLMRKQRIVLNVAHEVAHQWFGNLVTIEWWTHLWLNEGYATFLEYTCVNYIFPEYEIWMQFVAGMFTHALKLDSLNNSHPLEVSVGHPSEIMAIFDEISYNKGASIIRMLHDYIGNMEFRRGMNKYLTRHQYKNTCTEDLWISLQEASSKPVIDVMSTWTKLKGFPIVHVESEQLASNRRLIRLTQHKFTADGAKLDDNYTWVIPVAISHSDDTQQIAKTFLFDQNSMEFLLEDVSADDWIKVNAGTVGYYRTHYSKQMLEKLMPAVRDMELPPMDRLGLIDDMFAMEQAGQVSTSEVLEFIEFYRNETNYTVWNVITSSLSNLQILISHTDLIEDFNSYGEELYSPIFQRLGWDARDGENHLDKLLRSLALSRLVSFRCKDVIQEAKKRFRDHTDKIFPLSADLLSTCYIAVLQDGNIDILEEMLALYRSADMREEQERISYALGCIGDENLLRKVIDFAMSVEVRVQDSVHVFGAVAVNPRGREIAWQYFKHNSQQIYQRYQCAFLFPTLIKYLIINFESEERAIEVEQFFKRNSFPGTELTVSQAVERIRLNSSWLKRDLEALTQFLKKQ